jgi:enoyl-CoA hydratase/carnithine racemase
LRETKRQIYTDLHRDVGSAVKNADDLLERMMTEENYREAVRAHLEKRAPNWSGS